MHAERSSPNEKKRLVTWLILLAITAALFVWLLCKVSYTLTPMLARRAPSLSALVPGKALAASLLPVSTASGDTRANCAQS